MTYVETGVSKARFRFGDTLQATFEAVFANVPVFLLLALVITAIPNLVMALLFPPTTLATFSGFGFIGSLLRLVVSVGSAALLQGALVRGVITHLNGAKPSFAECLRAGLASAAPLVAIGLLFGLAVGFGTVLLIAPGLFLIALWGVVAPVQVVERRGVFGSFSRSADLTEGSRWGVLGVLIVMGLISGVASLLGVALIGLFTRLTGLDSLLAITAILTAAFNALAAIFSSAAPAAVYYNLRRSKEGAAPAELAAIFD